jgi:hypothetical protein
LYGVIELLLMDRSFVAGMVTSKVGKRHALTGFEALKELFISRFSLSLSLSQIS